MGVLESQRSLKYSKFQTFKISTHFFGYQNLPHPWFLTEDSHVNMTKVLEYFDAFTEPGDYICIEDTNPCVPSVSGQGLIKELGYTEFGPSKLNELKKFLVERSGRYHVDQSYTDLFG